VDSTRWSAALPAELEGRFQIDLTGSDALGNRNDRRSEWGKWRGEIDTRAPRLALAVSYIGEAPGPRFTIVSGSMEDLNLADSIGLTLDGQPAGCRFGLAMTRYQRGYNTLTAPGDAAQRLNRVDFACEMSGHVLQTVRFQACDTFGQCAATISTPSNAFLSGRNTLQRMALPNSAPAWLLNAQARGGMAADPQRNQIYWIGLDNTIKRANADGSGVTALVSGLTYSANDETAGALAVDSAAGKLYWGDVYGIYRANLDGSAREQLPTRSGARARALDPARGRLFWALNECVVFARTCDLYTANLDGSNARLLAPGSTSGINVYVLNGIAVDPASGKVFWVETFREPASTTGAMGNRMKLWITDPVLGTSSIFRQRDARATGALAVDPLFGKLYWTELPVVNGRDGSVATLRRAGAGVFYDIRLSHLVSGPDEEAVAAYDAFQTPRGIAFTSVAPVRITAPDLALSQTASRATLAPGDVLTFTLKIENSGPSQANGVVLTDTLPLGVSFLAATSDRGETCPAPAGALITCSLSPIQ
jgi:uncharacterized repeat protein (TIGR01451 family)